MLKTSQPVRFGKRFRERNTIRCVLVSMPAECAQHIINAWYDRVAVSLLAVRTDRTASTSPPAATGIKRAAEHYRKRFASPLSGNSCLQMASTTFRQDAGGAGHSGRQDIFGFLMHGGQSERQAIGWH